MNYSVTIRGLIAIPAYTSIVATLIGDTKAGLDWFLFENECGDKGYEAGIDEGETRPIKTVEDYLWLVDLNKDLLS